MYTKGAGVRIRRSFFLFVLFSMFLLEMAWLISCKTVVDDKELEARARSIHDRILTVDSHCDTPLRLLDQDWDIGIRHESGARGSGKIDLPRMAEGGLDAAFFAVFVGQGERTPEGNARAKEKALIVLEAIHLTVGKYPASVGLAFGPEDAYRLEREGKKAIFIGMENGYPIGWDLANLQEFHKQGIRYLTLCHTRDNDICDSSTDRGQPEDLGLSDFGCRVVEECNRLGIMVDVSHSSDRSFFDVIRVSRAPVIASHSSCRALSPSPRNLTDDMLKALAANGGVIQICFLSSFLRPLKPNPERDKALAELRVRYESLRETGDEAAHEKLRQEYEMIAQKYPGEKATVSDVVDHIEHVVKVVGIDHVGIGTDFDGGGGVEGCDDVSEMFRVTEELLRRGYGEEEIRKIWGANIMRVFSDAIKKGVTLREAR